MQMHSPRQLLRLAQEFDNKRKQTWQRDDGEEHARCQQAELRNKQPARDEKKHERDRNKAAPKVVENFPPRQRRDRIADAATLGVANARQQPRQNLPVASNPAMPPDGVCASSASSCDISGFSPVSRFTSASVSRKPRKICGSRIFSSTSPRNPQDSVSKCPARLPLSTLET